MTVIISIIGQPLRPIAMRKPVVRNRSLEGHESIGRGEKCDLSSAEYRLLQPCGCDVGGELVEHGLAGSSRDMAQLVHGPYDWRLEQRR